MNKFVSWCRHLLVSFLFHALTSLYPPSFHRNDFSTCSTHFSFLILGQSLIKIIAPRAHFYACACRQPTCVMHVNGVISVSAVEEPHDLPKECIYSERKTIAQCLCTPPLTVETFGEKISAEAYSGKDLLKKIRMKMMNKWKNHFYEMKGDVVMSLHEKRRNKMPTPRHKVTYNPIPTSLFCFNMLFVMNALGKANSTTS